MKKLILALALFLGLTFTSCNGSSSETVTDTVDSVEVVTDSIAQDTTYVNVLTVDGDTVAVDTIQ